MSLKNIFARKNLEALQAEAAGEQRLHRALGPWSLTAMGIGCIIGAGIFVMTGRAAALDAGPAVIVSYAIAGLGCVMAAMCYAEFAAMAPVAGSAYTYAYTTLGEIFAWIIGWDLILEYAMGCATVASAWTNYFNSLLTAATGSSPIPAWLCHDPFSGGIINLPSGRRDDDGYRHSRVGHPRKRVPTPCRGRQAGDRVLCDRSGLGLCPSGELDKHSRCRAALQAGAEGHSGCCQKISRKT